MILGDSLTWGAGLSIKERYSDRLAQLLNRHYSNRSIEVLNFGHSGAPTTRERDTLLHYKDFVAPNLIIVGFCVNAPQPQSQNYSVEMESFERKFAPYIKNFRKFMNRIHLNYAGDALIKAVYRVAGKRGIYPDWHIALNRVYETDSTEWKEFTNALKDIKTISDSLQLPPPILAALNQGSFLRDSYQKKWFQQVTETASTIGFTTITYEHEIEKQVKNGNLTRQNMNVSPLDGHPSAKLNKIYAQGLFKAVLDIIETQEVSNE